ncbi:MAG: hypothetical protein U0174_22985 [Polyangiaceae bacterium]
MPSPLSSREAKGTFVGALVGGAGCAGGGAPFVSAGAGDGTTTGSAGAADVEEARVSGDAGASNEGPQAANTDMVIPTQATRKALVPTRWA